MKERVLFTCVGSTDPVRGLRDGAMLHIVRHYHPEKVYMVLSKEMKEKNDDDRRFELALNDFSDRFNFPLEYEFIDTDIEDVSDFDAFMDLFHTHISRIRTMHNDAEILLNVSSGSPQMKLSMCLLAEDIRYNNLLPVQVKSPEKESNKSSPTTKKDYSLHEEIELNEDNENDAENRCLVPALLQAKRVLMKNRIIALVTTYQYEEAKALMDDFQMSVDSVISSIIEHLVKRTKLIKDIEILRAGIDFNFYPVQREPFRALIDYYMVLKSLHKSNRLSEFILRLNPLIIRLQMEYLNLVFNFEISRVIKEANKGDLLDGKALKSDYPGLYDYLDKKYLKTKGGIKEDSNISMVLLNGMMSFYNSQTNNNHQGQCDFFKNCEAANTKVRNIVAHQLTEIYEKDIQRYANMSSQKILVKIQTIIGQLYGTALPSNSFDIYDDLNKIIISRL
ncbi:hypothetical protein MASR2M70_16460 [Bacillota bacterium]